MHVASLIHAQSNDAGDAALVPAIAGQTRGRVCRSVSMPPLEARPSLCLGIPVERLPPKKLLLPSYGASSAVSFPLLCEMSFIRLASPAYVVLLYLYAERNGRARFDFDWKDLLAISHVCVHGA